MNFPKEKIERQISIQTAVGWRNNDRLRQDFGFGFYYPVSTNRRSTGCAAATATSLGLREQSEEAKNEFCLKSDENRFRLFLYKFGP